MRPVPHISLIPRRSENFKRSQMVFTAVETKVRFLRMIVEFCLGKKGLTVFKLNAVYITEKGFWCQFLKATEISLFHGDFSLERTFV